MRVFPRMVFATACLCLVAAAGMASAQMPYAPPGQASPTVTITEASLNEMVNRLDRLESAIHTRTPITGTQEIEIPSSPTMKMTGRIHLDMWSFPQTSPGIGEFEHSDPGTVADPNPQFGTDPEDRLVFRRARLGFKGMIQETMLYKLEVDFNNPGTPEYKDMYIGWTALPWNQTVLIGNQKRPLGLDHLTSSRYNVFAERPLVVEAFNEDARRMGLAAYGYTDNELFHWRYGVYALENTSKDGRSIGDALQLSANARLSSSPWYDDTSGGRGYFHWAVAGMYADPDSTASGAVTNSNDGRFRTRAEARSSSRWLDTGRIAGINDYSIMGLESILNLGSLQIVGEYQCNWSNRSTATGPDLFFQGAYVYASYFLTGEHQGYNRQQGVLERVKPFENFFLVSTHDGGHGLGLGALQVAARYSHLDLSDDNVLGGVGNNFTMGLNWFWTPYSKVQLNYIAGNITDHAAVVPGGYTSGNYQMLGARFMADF